MCFICECTSDGRKRSDVSEHLSATLYSLTHTKPAGYFVLAGRFLRVNYRGDGQPICQLFSTIRTIAPLAGRRRTMPSTPPRAPGDHVFGFVSRRELLFLISLALRWSQPNMTSGDDLGSEGRRECDIHHLTRPMPFGL